MMKSRDLLLRHGIIVEFGTIMSGLKGLLFALARSSVMKSRANCLAAARLSFQSAALLRLSMGK